MFDSDVRSDTACIYYIDVKRFVDWTNTQDHRNQLWGRYLSLAFPNVASWECEDALDSKWS